MTYGVQSFYKGDLCDTFPYMVVGGPITEGASCKNVTCTDTESFVFSMEGSMADESFDKTTFVCSELGYMGTMRETFDHTSTPYIIVESYWDVQCFTFLIAYGFPVAACVGAYNSSLYIKSTLDADSGASIKYFNDNLCLKPNGSDTADKAELTAHSCVATTEETFNYGKWYSSSDTSSDSNSNNDGNGSVGNDSNSSISTGVIIAIIMGVIVIIIMMGIIFYRLRAHAGDKHFSTTADTLSLEAAMSGQHGLWNDDVITAKRIPRDKVRTKKLISRGAFGEVYSGVFNRQKVAVKMLLPQTRTDLRHVNEFLTEVKLTAMMDHPHVVTFVGVAWDSLSDLCVVLEFLDGGDLRALLDKYKTSNHPVGFDHKKVIIALHVCHALTYLHSLLPPVIHRDLKSRNILLNKALEAKLTDFGISRERLDQTMTAGVGTSLWMAPEVMLGEKYDVKADMFSFGVVMSELDVHAVPYAQAKQRSLDTHGRRMSDANLLQKITMGEIRVEFSETNPEDLVELGLACVAVDPSDRPTAAEALYRLQVISSKL